MSYKKKYMKYKTKYVNLKHGGDQTQKVSVLKDKKYFVDVMNLINKLPIDKIIKKDDINFGDDDIFNLTHYVYLSFPSYHKFFGDDDVKEFNKMIERIPNNSLIFAPGDSPFKLVHIIELLHKVGENTIEFDGNRKNVRFITFPFSKPTLHYNLNYNQVYEEFGEFMGKIRDVNKYENFIFYDYVETGRTFYYISTLIKHFFLTKYNREINCELYKIGDIFNNDIMFNAENYGARCIRSTTMRKDVSLGDKFEKHLLKCNAITLFYYYVILKYDVIVKMVEKVQDILMPIDKFYEYNNVIITEMTYYSGDSNSIEKINGVYFSKIEYNYMSLVKLNKSDVHILFESSIKSQYNAQHINPNCIVELKYYAIFTTEDKREMMTEFVMDLISRDENV